MTHEYERVTVPFTTKMNNLEKLYYHELLEEVNKYVTTTQEWLQTPDGLEYLHTKNTQQLKPIKKLLQKTHINTHNLNNYLQLNYDLGSSQAHNKINKKYYQRTKTDEESIKLLLTGVQETLNKFEKIITEDIIHTLKDITPDKFKNWLQKNQQKHAPK